jgi:hypothetical protein
MAQQFLRHLTKGRLVFAMALALSLGAEAALAQPQPPLRARFNMPPAGAGAQPNYIYALAQTAAPANRDQYVPSKLNLDEAHTLSTGNR